MNDITPEDLVLKIENMKLQNMKLQNTRKKVYIKRMLESFPVLTNKLTPDNIYNNSAIEKNGNWDQFKESLMTFLRNKESEYKTKSRSSGVPPSARPLPSARPPPKRPVRKRPPKRQTHKRHRQTPKRPVRKRPPKRQTPKRHF